MVSQGFLQLEERDKCKEQSEDPLREPKREDPASDADDKGEEDQWMKWNLYRRDYLRIRRIRAEKLVIVHTKKDFYSKCRHTIHSVVISDLWEFRTEALNC